MEDFFKGVGTFVSALVLIGVALFLQPVIYVGFGYLGGLVVKWIFGGIVSDGFNNLFGTTRFTESSIPVVTASMALAGSYFKSSLTNKKENK